MNWHTCNHDDDGIDAFCPCVLALYYIGADVRDLTHKRRPSKATLKWYKKIVKPASSSYYAGYDYIYGPSLWEVAV